MNIPYASGYLLLLVGGCVAWRIREPPPPTPVSRQTPVERWISVKLNHFMPSDTRTFPMRFYYNDEFPGPNIVIKTGGEGEIDPGWITAGMPYRIAEQLRAGLFHAEHRYYGQTRPFNNTEVSNLQFLTVEQALADLAQFITYVKSDAFEKGRYKSGKVVMVGCPYGGSMATWMKRSYPHLVDAVYSDSGPVLAQDDFYDRLWAYQTCMEFGWHQTTTSLNQPFLSTVSLEYKHQCCKDTFSKVYTEERHRRGIQRINIIFGGLRRRPDHVISVASTFDPWSTLAPNATHGHPKSPVYVVPEISHCKVFCEDEKEDSKEIIAARKAVLNFMYENVIGPIPMGGATEVDATLVLLVSALLVLF